jgi:phenylacetate-CoA ligase
MRLLNKIDEQLLTLKGILLFFFKFRYHPHWKTTRLNRYKFKKLKKLLIESGKNVPYYKSLFKQIKFDPKRDFNSLEDIKKIPTLKKEIVKSSPESFYNERFKKGKYIELKTSGSTGMPLEVRVSKNAWIVEQAVVWRHWRWANYNFRDVMAIVRSYVGKDGVLYKDDNLRNFQYYSPFHINDENGKKYIERMIKKKTLFLRGYPSSIKSLALIVQKFNLETPKLKAVLVASERLSESDRKIIEDNFKTRVYNHYGLADICVMMGDCEKHEGLHNYEDYGHLELLEQDGYADNIRKIIGTHLHNTAMPLIRYETGDLGEINEIECSCRRNFPTLKNILGRNDSVIRTTEGFEIPTVNFYTMFEYFLEIKKWQIIQENITDITVNVLTDNISDELENKIFQGMGKRLPDSIKIKVNWNSDLEKKGEGKIPVFISKV